jgi:poly(A) polymerase
MTKVDEIIKSVQEIVSPTYLVGGSVRDMLLKREPKDYDFATPLSPDEVEDKVKAAGRHVYAIGKKFGTIGFKVTDESGKFNHVEVTTFRSETYSPGNRKPNVEFVGDLKSDLSRRDFTINAIAFDKDYIDPFGGRLDILAKKIKAVGEATDRFKEDPLRMLRAARFAAQLGFEVDPNMIGKMRKMAEKILEISRERWVMELDKLLIQDDFSLGLLVLMQSFLMKYMLPEIYILLDTPAGWALLLDAIASTPPEPNERWVGLLSVCAAGFFSVNDINSEYYGKFKGHELVAPEVARGIGLRLKFSNDRMELIATKLHDKLNKN